MAIGPTWTCEYVDRLDLEERNSLTPYGRSRQLVHRLCAVITAIIVSSE